MLHEIRYIWLHYFWPSDLGNGPESIQEMVLLAVLSSFIYPPLRHYIQREFEKIHHKLDHVTSGTTDPYEEPEWDRFEHWVAKLIKLVTRPFRKKAL